MKSKILFLGSWIIGVCVLLSCSSSIKEKSNVIDVASAMSNPTELKASDYFTKVKYIPLETTDESIIGTGAKVNIFGDKIMVTTSQNQCLLFDKETGRFLTTVGHYGEDPEGYRASSGWINNQTKTILLNSWNTSWVTYNESGEFKERISPPEGISTQGSFVPLDKERIVAHTMDFFSDGIESLRFFNKDSILKTITLHEQDGNYNVNNIESISVLKGEHNQEVYGGTAGVMVINFKDAPGKAYIGMVGLDRLWTSDNEIYFKEDYNDTIYHVKDYTLEAAYILNMGEYHWPYEERFNMEHDRSLFVTRILDSKELMLFRLVHRLFTNDKRKSYNAIYNKSNGELTISPIEDGIKDDLTNFFPFRPYTVSSTGEYTGFIQAFDVVEWFEEHGTNISDLPKEIQSLKAVEEEDNPVVVILE